MTVDRCMQLFSDLTCPLSLCPPLSDTVRRRVLLHTLSPTRPRARPRVCRARVRVKTGLECPPRAPSASLTCGRAHEPSPSPRLRQASRYSNHVRHTPTPAWRAEPRTSARGGVLRDRTAPGHTCALAELECALSCAHPPPTWTGRARAARADGLVCARAELTRGRRGAWWDV